MTYLNVELISFLLTISTVNVQSQVSGDVRLEDGSTSAGRLEVYYFGEWRAVCKNGFDHVDATVACKTLGFDYGLYDGNTYGAGAEGTCIDSVNCDGSEASFARCGANFPAGDRPNPADDVSIACYYVTTITTSTSTSPAVTSVATANGLDSAETIAIIVVVVIVALFLVIAVVLCCWWLLKKETELDVQYTTARY